MLYLTRPDSCHCPKEKRLNALTTESVLQRHGRHHRPLRSEAGQDGAGMRTPGRPIRQFLQTSFSSPEADLDACIWITIRWACSSHRSFSDRGRRDKRRRCCAACSSQPHSHRRSSVNSCFSDNFFIAYPHEVF
jgi:hypothetical protein